MALAPSRPDAAADAFLSERADTDPRLVVDVGGYEGPLDLLLDLARHQKVDLAKISILALADQYLDFIAKARALRLELAADYLLMAAWLAYLKSRLLLRDIKNDDEPSGAELASELAARLERLERIRVAGEYLVARRRLGIDVFARGAPEGMARVSTSVWQASLVDLLKAYAERRVTHALARVTMPPRKVWSLVEAREALERLIGVALEWTELDTYLLAYVVEPEMRVSVLASSFATSLELVREGAMELRQSGAFKPLFVKQRIPAGDAAKPDGADE